MEHTTNLKLPLLIPNQSGKEFTYNEALVIIDNILQNGVVDKDLLTPPDEPNINDVYIVGSGATGAWNGKDKQLAFYDNGWRFVEAREGFIFWVNDEDKLYSYNGSEWIEAITNVDSGTSGVTELKNLTDVSITSTNEYDILQYDGTNFVNTKSPQHLSMIGINTDADVDNKLSVKSDYVLFDNIGESSKIKVNKSTEPDTASHLFQNSYEGRAEFGLIGNDNFTLKVSNDSENWIDVFVVDKETGNIDFKGDLTNNSKNFMTLPTTKSEIGLVKSLQSGIGQSLYLPAGGTWVVFSTFCINNSNAIVYNFSGDDNVSVAGPILAGGSLIRKGREGYFGKAIVMKIQ